MSLHNTVLFLIIKRRHISVVGFLFLLLSPFPKLSTWRLGLCNVIIESYSCLLTSIGQACCSLSFFSIPPPPLSAVSAYMTRHPKCSHVKWWGATGSLISFVTFRSEHEGRALMATIGDRLYGLSQEPALGTRRREHPVQYITMKALYGMSKLKM